MKCNDTIAAISTPPGEGGIAVVRMSGTSSLSIIRKVFRGKNPIQKNSKGQVYHGWIVEKDEPIDEVVLTLFHSPHSYTGEDVIEVSCHGGLFISRRILEVLIQYGARPAEPGEFTQRAFFNGKMDLTQAEAVADLIRAKTESARRVAIYELEGHLSGRLQKIREDLIKICSLLEVELDFGEEDIMFVSRKEIKHLLIKTRGELQHFVDSYRRGKVCREGIRMVIAGRPNVGKSSLLNGLVERERAIVTEIPGTTRDTVEDVLDIEGFLFTVTDTAGIRETQDPIEREGVRRTEKVLDISDLVLLVFDGSESLNREDEMIVRRVKEMRKPVIVLINKIDLKQQINIHKLKKWFPDEEVLRISALKKEHVSRLVQTLKGTAISGGIPHEGEVLITRARHKNCILHAIELIKKAEASLRKSMSQEFIVMDIRGALDVLGEMIGKTVTDDILNQIFSDFCVGK
ncbi:tRNA uridine-5-carboxymethylaminomethyl(34) synthesis GTPase MnmE [bacterium]|nr:tRNA uridine-5-carboxymethylaminomethyl(34) synthesis GTPase MnmE [bacterium]RQV93310.1 MAG: tRNA uridine-5-carboxymethylaminomethyl(34) synthesis GTPase MnmE [bacterium]